MGIKESIKKFLGISEPKIEDLNRRIEERILEAKQRKRKKVTRAISVKGAKKKAEKQVRKRPAKKTKKRKK